MKNISKKTLIITTIIILLPILIGVIMWNDLPDTLNIHWGFDGSANGTGGKAFAVFGMPLILLAVQCLCIFITTKDPHNRNQTGKVMDMVLWAIPCISVFSSSIIYASALGYDSKAEITTPILLGLMFVIIGNYLPKCRQNYTIGIKLPSTYSSEENWNSTHRLGGKLWVIGGIVMLISVFLPTGIMAGTMVTAMVVMIIVPMVYSYVFYKKQLSKGEITSGGGQEAWNRKYRKTNKPLFVFLIIIIVAVICLCFTGDMEIIFGESSMRINVDYWEDLEIPYDEVDNIEYREDFKGGVRTFGFGSFRLVMGSFKNDELGSYTRYGYTNCHSCVILESQGEYLVISGRNDSETRVVYQSLTERCEAIHE